MIDLGLDLLGAAPASFTRALARQRHIDIDGLFDGDRYRFDGIDGYLAARAAAAILTRAEDYMRLAEIVLEDRTYTELRLTPDPDLPAWRDRIDAIREGAAGRPHCLIATLPREVGPDRARKLALAAAEAGVAGLALAGDERVGAIKDYAWSLDCGREAGLALILDAGRFGVDPVREALAFAPARLAHALHALDDLALVDRLAEQRTVLSLSPATDIAFGLVRDWRSHPAGALFHREVRIVIGNEAPAYAPAATQDRLADAFDWDDGAFATLRQNVLDAAQCDDTTRTRLKEMQDA